MALSRTVIVDLVPEWNGNCNLLRMFHETAFVDLVPEWNGNVV